MRQCSVLVSLAMLSWEVSAQAEGPQLAAGTIAFLDQQRRRHQELEADRRRADAEVQAQIAADAAEWVLGQVQMQSLTPFGAGGSEPYLPVGELYPLSCTNMYGVTWEVPFGQYRGDAIVPIRNTMVSNSLSPVFQHVGLGHWPTDPLSGVREPFDNIPDNAGVLGWDFEPHGVLREELVVADERARSGGVDCRTLLRYTYEGPSGLLRFQQPSAERTCAHRVESGTGSGWCGIAERSSCVDPSFFVSTEGRVTLDLSDPSAPVIRQPDGRMEVLRAQLDGLAKPYRAWVTSETVDPNGNSTRYEWIRSRSGGLEHVASITDELGRVTTFERVPEPDLASLPAGRAPLWGWVTAVTRPGPGGALQRWELEWETRSYEPSEQFPDIPCFLDDHPLHGGTYQDLTCPTSYYRTLRAIRYPDGRDMRFDYTPWGALREVVAPEGAVTRFAYGAPGVTSSFWPPQAMPSACPGDTPRLLARRPVSRTILPDGPEGPAHETRLEHEWTEPMGPGARRGRCSALQWHAEHGPRVWNAAQERWSERITRTAVCVTSGPEEGIGGLAGRTIAIEVYDGDQLVEATYSGNTGHIGDSRTTPGTPYLIWETGSTQDASFPTNLDPVTGEQRRWAIGGSNLDTRTSRLVHFRDGLFWTELVGYDESAELVDGGTRRTYGNVACTLTVEGRSFEPWTGRCQDPPAGARVLVRKDSAFVTDEEYRAVNLVRLEARTEHRDGEGSLLRATEYRYDEHALSPAPGARPSNVARRARGNLTSTVELDPSGQSPPIASHRRYYETGETRVDLDARGQATTFEYDSFADCSSDRPTVRKTTINPLGHRTIAVMDCWTGLELSTVDPNGARRCMAYDALGRLVQRADPGDGLNASDPNLALAEAQCLAAAQGDGPTAWLDHEPPGQQGPGKTITHVRDGTSDGLYTTSFADGLGRVRLTCREGDPATLEGAPAAAAIQICAADRYDPAGNLAEESEPWARPSSDRPSEPPEGTAFARIARDVLGRELARDRVRRQAGADRVLVAGTVATFGNDGSSWTKTLVHRNGPDPGDDRVTVTATNLLGHVVEVRRVAPDSGCPNGVCVERYARDALGRLQSITDRTGHNVLGYELDGFGRRVAMNDPDLGRWTYEYDAAGQVTARTDARGQTIRFCYDEIGRVTLRDLPGSDDDDVVTYYDGDGPSGCHGCDVQERRDRCEPPPSAVARLDVPPASTGPAPPGARLVARWPAAALLVTLGTACLAGPAEESGGGGELVPGELGRMTAYGTARAMDLTFHDGRGRPSRVDYLRDGAIFSVLYEYGDPHGGSGPGSVMIAQVFPDGERVELGYDRAGHETTLRAGGDVIVSARVWNARGQLVRATSGNGVTSAWRFDDDDDPQVDAVRLTGPSDVPLTDLRIERDPLGNPISIEDRVRPEHSSTYRYDTLNRLVSWTKAGQEHRYRYDAIDNLIELDGRAQGYGAAGKPHVLSRSGDDAYAVDANGSVTTIAGAGVTSFTWSPEGMATAIERRDADGAVTTVRREFRAGEVWRRTEGSTVRYDLPSFQVEARVGQDPAAGRLRKFYGGFAERGTDGALHYLHADEMSSTTLVTDAQGGESYRAYYDPWGRDDEDTGQCCDRGVCESTTDCPFVPTHRYQGKQVDAAGLYDFGARLYDPRTGRWISADPALEELNRTAFVRNNPLALRDPDGHQSHGSISARKPTWSEVVMLWILEKDRVTYDNIVDTQRKLRHAWETIQQVSEFSRYVPGWTGTVSEVVAGYHESGLRGAAIGIGFGLAGGLDDAVRAGWRLGSRKFASWLTKRSVAAAVSAAEHNAAFMRSREFMRALMGESIGGNAGTGNAVVRLILDREGRAVAVGNIQHLPRDIQEAIHSGALADVPIRVKILGDGPAYQAFTQGLGDVQRRAIEDAVELMNRTSPDHMVNVTVEMVLERLKSGHYQARP